MSSIDDAGKVLKSKAGAAADDLRGGVDAAAEALHDGADNAAQSAAQAIDGVSDVLSAMAEKEAQLRSAVIDYVRRYPIGALAIGVAAGYVLSGLTRTR